MKVDEQRRVISDRISPANERFFVTIKEVSDAEKRMRCDESEYGLSITLTVLMQTGV